mgnify:FL=1|jgi:hypothetical protein|tara:strand:+ start:2900 stop:3718 length:819 start_codon:yes stop_codon:yes gene_type:complete
MNKKIYFISGFPRAGNTVLASILNQNKKIKTTAHSLLPDIIYTLDKLKEKPIYKNFPDEKSFDNVIENIFTNYYKDWDCEYIIERGDWITPENLFLLEKHFKNNEIKIVILVRNILDILGSYLQIAKRNPLFFINKIYDEKNNSEMLFEHTEEKADIVMEKNGYVHTVLYSIKNLLKSKFKNYIFIDYDDLLNNPKETLDKIYNFYGIEKYDHDYNNIKQFKVNDVSYNDKNIGAKIHALREGKLERNIYGVKVPQRVVDKYSNLEFWKKNE